jgi:choice-of-anchor A domain-containing protein
LAGPATAQAGIGLGSAAPYNVLVFGNYSAMNSDSEGRLAVGGDLTVQNYSVGSSLSSYGVTSADGPGLVVGGDLNWTNGQVFVGDAVYGGTATTSGFNTLNGSLVQGSAIDFAAVKSEMLGLSSSWAGLASNGNVSFVNGPVLTGSDSGLNVFSFDASQWTGEIKFDVPTGSQAIVNISGSTASIPSAGFFLNGIAPEDVFFNFFEAETLTASGVGIYGNILAPNADVAFNNGQMNGNLVADSFNGTLEFHLTNPPPPSDPPTDPPGDPVPEPLTALIWAGLGLGGLGYWRRRKTMVVG